MREGVKHRGRRERLPRMDQGYFFAAFFTAFFVAAFFAGAFVTAFLAAAFFTAFLVVAIVVILPFFSHYETKREKIHQES